MATKKEALNNGTALRTVFETAGRLATARKDNVAALVAAWAPIAKAKGKAKADGLKQIKRSFISGYLCAHFLIGLADMDAREARAGAIIDGTEPGRKAKTGQIVRTKPEQDAFKRADVQFSEMKGEANIPTLKPDGSVKKKAVRAPRAAKAPADTTPDPAAKDAGAEKKEATPPARTKADYVAQGRAFASTMLAWHNKNAAQAVAPIASAIQDFVKAVNAYKD